ncbi:LUD domain-containing protein [Salinarchaeum sp. IM2453]|uniref:LUD domain-containing protein n=1 Tax=Salinarchaeum sp. IM2453 TaxID=2862870 RepID=UPI001C829BA9|nr:LUD domain-containing protein [Salinarchaeum sp. IM2453]QZA88249.1 LUD domain-containing protein [Salinarchaeum sp. IM2453]
MSQSAVETFRSSLNDHGISLYHTSPEACADLIEEHLVQPATGVSLPFDGVTLPDSISTDITAGELKEAHTGVTPAAAGVADYGSVLIESTPEGTEPISLFNNRHIVVLHEDDLLASMRQAITWIGGRTQESDASFVVATGPSATADMGGLVQGAHGPEEVIVIMIGENNE